MFIIAAILFIRLLSNLISYVASFFIDYYNDFLLKLNDDILWTHFRRKTKKETEEVDNVTDSSPTSLQLNGFA